MPTHPRAITRVLLSQEQIRDRVQELGEELTSRFSGKEISAVMLMHGSVFFAADLLRHVVLPMRIHTMDVSSYAGTKSTGELTIVQTPGRDLSGRDVLLIDDILDTGLTLGRVKDLLFSECGAASVTTCVLLHKDLTTPQPLTADYSGFHIPDEFVVGYGMDYRGHWRNLPYIGVLNPDAL